MQPFCWEMYDYHKLDTLFLRCFSILIRSAPLWILELGHCLFCLPIVLFGQLQRILLTGQVTFCTAGHFVFEQSATLQKYMIVIMLECLNLADLSCRG